jgi:trk system potassium uptake protein TrkA
VWGCTASQVQEIALHIVIMGCGRVGSALAEHLDADGHSVAVIDQDPLAFRKLSSTFAGRTVTGVGFDRDRLKEAGIERADAFAAVSSGDNSNIISARVARETFGVKNVVARIYDPRRAEIYQRLGIETVATVAWTTQQIIRRIQPIAAEEYRDSTGSLALAELPFNSAWIGHKISKLGLDSGARIGYVVRFGIAILPNKDTVIQEGDIVHAIFKLDEQETVVRVFNNPPEE